MRSELFGELLTSAKEMVEMENSNKVLIEKKGSFLYVRDFVTKERLYKCVTVTKCAQWCFENGKDVVEES